MTDKARAELAPTGVLRAGINLSNFLLVTGRTEKAEPVGVAPDVAKAIAASRYVFDSKITSASAATSSATQVVARMTTMTFSRIEREARGITIPRAAPPAPGRASATRA